MRTLAVLALFALPAAAEWEKLDGQKAPPLTAKEWLNTGGAEPTAASLRGRVWLLEFFASW